MRRSTSYPARSGRSAAMTRSIAARSSGVTRSSASSESAQGCAACSSAKFFCSMYPGQPRSITRAPKPFAISTVRSFDPESTTTISSQKRRLSRQAPMFGSSFTQMTQALSLARLIHESRGASLVIRAVCGVVGVPAGFQTRRAASSLHPTRLTARCIHGPHE